jgi:nuclease HARBI1
MRILRRNVRDMAYNKRHLGLTSKEALYKSKLEEAIGALFILIEDDNDPCLEAATALLSFEYDQMIRSSWLLIKSIKPGVRIETFGDAFCWNQLRFRKSDLRRLYNCFHIPGRMQLGNGSWVNGEEAMLSTIYRFSHSDSLQSIVNIFGRDYSLWSRVFLWMIKYLYDNFRHLLHNNLDYFEHKFQDYNNAISRRIMKNGEEMNGRIKYTIGFVDAKKCVICKPKGLIQELFYNRHKQVHCFKIQTFVGPDGLYMDVSKPYPGARHDAIILADSNLNEKLANTQYGNRTQYTFYADKGYPIQTSHGRAAYRENEWILPNQRRENNMMTAPRAVAAEFAFGKPANIHPYCDYKKRQKAQKSWVAKYYAVSLLICNAHSCLYGNATSAYFNMDTPSLEEYFDL